MNEQSVALRRELSTEMGTFSAGCVFLAERVGADWRLNLVPSRDGSPGHTVIVADSDVYCLTAGLRRVGQYGLIPTQLDRAGFARHIGRGAV